MDEADTFLFEALLIFALILVNGFFAGAEIAVVSSGRRELEEMEKQGSRGARLVRRWLDKPDDFLATVQIGITLVGALASAIGGATAIKWLEPQLAAIPMLARWSEALAILAVVLPITYVSLVLGELLPKSLAFRYRERAAVLVAPFIQGLGLAAKPIVRLLSYSTRILLALFEIKPGVDEPRVSREELRWLLKEGAARGVFNTTEQQLIPRVLDFGNLLARDVMVPRSRIVAISYDLPLERILHVIEVEHYTRMPVYRETPAHVVGILHIKDINYLWSHGELFHMADIIRPPVIVAETLPIKDVLSLFQKRHLHMAIVVNRAGETEGLVTLEDLVERIVGDIQDEHD